VTDRLSRVNFARSLWLRVETLHAVAYFGDETGDAARSLGITGFWSSYFAFRAAPMGPVEAGLVEAVFFNFAPSLVQRWVPAVWTAATPEELVTTRREAAARTLQRLYPEIAGVAAEVNTALEDAVGRCRSAGRPLFASNRALALPDDPVERLWQLCTSLREHRGDGHVAALTTHGLDGLAAHVLIALEGHGATAEDLQRTRGWTPDDWSAAVDRCASRGWVRPDGTLITSAQQLRREIEATTDRLADEPFVDVDRVSQERLLHNMTAAAVAVSNSGTIRYPNPIGLPALSP